MGGWMAGWMGYRVGQGFGSCLITKNSINQNLIEIIQFCVKIYDLWRHPPHSGTPKSEAIQ